MRKVNYFYVLVFLYSCAALAGCENNSCLNCDDPPVTPEECVVDFTVLGSEEIYDFFEQSNYAFVVLLYVGGDEGSEEYRPIFQETCVDFYYDVVFIEIDIKKHYEEGNPLFDFYTGNNTSTHFLYRGEEIKVDGNVPVEIPIIGAVDGDVLREIVDEFLTLVY